MSLQIVDSELKRTILEKINCYLEDMTSGKAISEWALSMLRDRNFTNNEALIEDALIALATLHDQDNRFDTARQDLEQFRDCLLGKRRYRRDHSVVRRHSTKGNALKRNKRLKGA